jgi:hypothetical protein
MNDLVALQSSTRSRVHSSDDLVVVLSTTSLTGAPDLSLLLLPG